MDKQQIIQVLRHEIGATDREISAFISELDNFLGKNLRKILKGLESGKASAIEAAQVLGGLQTSLQEAGINDVLSKLADIYAAQLDKVKATFEKVSGKDMILTNADIDVLHALITFDSESVANRVTSYVDDYKSIVMRSVIAGEAPDLSQIHDEVSPRVFSNIQTEVNTGLASFSRSVTNIKAESADLNYALYAGPEDSVTRPFCQARVNEVWSRAAIESAAWQDAQGQGLPVATYLGGYNCRHRLLWLPDADAEQLGISG